jgi:hypothetical protein
MLSYILAAKFLGLHHQQALGDYLRHGFMYQNEITVVVKDLG